jgi:hypothetical protein
MGIIQETIKNYRNKRKINYMIWIIILIIAIVILKYFYDLNKTKNELLKNGGVIKKYSILIEHLMNNSHVKMKLYVNKNNRVIVAHITKRGRIYFEVQEVSNKVFIDYIIKSPLKSNILKMNWKYDSSENQKLIFDKISSDITYKRLTINNRILDAILMISNSDKI